jgi:nucleoside-diphosphate-sugar epimerase
VAGKIIVAGISGFVGSTASRQLVADGWNVVGISRRAPAMTVAGVDCQSVDLLDNEACNALAARHTDATHIVYAAINETAGGLVAGWSDSGHAERNGTMFSNLLDAFVVRATAIEHVTAVHGAKAYATNRTAHSAIPLKESMPRPPTDDFYFRQEDFLWQRASEHDFAWTTFRPSLIVGGGQGSNLSSILAMAVYASLWREAGLPAPFPGSPDARGVNQMTDANLLARAISWATQAPDARNSIFNITNGDVFAWEYLWPILTEEIGVVAGAPGPIKVQDYVKDHAATWGRLVRRHSLKVDEDPFAYLGESYALADYTLDKAWRSIVLSNIAILKAGFTDCIDTGESIRGWIARWRELGMLPPR